MNQKEYELYDGRTITFFFDDGKVGYITLHAMDALVGEIQKLAAERDAAIADLKEYSYCDVCKNNNDECLNNGLCKECSVGKSTRHHWEWRGVQE